MVLDYGLGTLAVDSDWSWLNLCFLLDFELFFELLPAIQKCARSSTTPFLLFLYLIFVPGLVLSFHPLYLFFLNLYRCQTFNNLLKAHLSIDQFPDHDRSFDGLDEVESVRQFLDQLFSSEVSKRFFPYELKHCLLYYYRHVFRLYSDWIIQRNILSADVGFDWTFPVGFLPDDPVHVISVQNIDNVSVWKILDHFVEVNQLALLHLYGKEDHF